MAGNQRSAFLVIAVAIAALSACGGGSSAHPAPKTVTVTARPSTGASTTSSNSATDSPSTPAGSQASTATLPTPETTGPPVITGSATVIRTLTLADIFSSSGWTEGSVTVPKSKGPIQAISTSVGCNNSPSLELRFGDQQGVLTVKVAQALQSRTSGVTLEFQLQADRRLVDTKLVRFNDQQILKADLTGVSSVILTVKRTQSSATCDTTAVLMDLSIVPPAT